MTEWAVVQHVPFEGPGSIADVAAEHDVALRLVRTWAGDPLPSADALDGLVVLGGPMGALDDHEYPTLAAERRLLADAVRAGVPVLAVCLGAQLLAAALGASVRRGPVDEIGVGTVRVLQPGPLREGADAAGVLPVVHWHRDTFDLPPGAQLLASSDVYRHQAFSTGPGVLALQFHVEANRAWAAAAAPGLPPGVELDETDLDRVERAGRRALHAFFMNASSLPTTPV
jgi:GMP synthase-like glutamine amidotransferase